MQTLKEIRAWFLNWRITRSMRGRSPEAELWVFSEGKIHVKPRPDTLPKLLVELGLAESNAEATRLLKSNAVQQREWYGEDWWHAPEIVEGTPQWIRRGKKFYGVVTYMLPLPDQTEYTWSELVLDKKPKLRWM